MIIVKVAMIFCRRERTAYGETDGETKAKNDKKSHQNPCLYCVQLYMKFLILGGGETDGETAWGNSHPLVEKQMSKIVNFYTPLFVEIAKYCDYAHSV